MTWFFLNIFVLILLQGIEETYKKEFNPLEILDNHFLSIQIAWHDKTFTRHNRKLHYSQILSFLFALNEPIGLNSKHYYAEYYLEKLRYMRIMISDDGYLSFQEMLFPIFKEHFNDYIKIDEEIEEDTEQYSQIKNALVQSEKNYYQKLYYQQNLQNITQQKYILVVTKYIYARMVFKSWKRMLELGSESELNISESYNWTQTQDERTAQFSYQSGLNNLDRRSNQEWQNGFQKQDSSVNSINNVEDNLNGQSLRPQAPILQKISEEVFSQNLSKISIKPLNEEDDMFKQFATMNGSANSAQNFKCSSYASFEKEDKLVNFSFSNLNISQMKQLNTSQLKKTITQPQFLSNQDSTNSKQS